MFRAYVMENLLAFRAAKAAQRIPADDIHPKGFANFVPELFKPNRGFRITFRPQERRTFATSHNARILSRCSFGGRLNEITHNLKKSSLVRHVIDHECGERLGNI